MIEMSRRKTSSKWKEEEKWINYLSSQQEKILLIPFSFTFLLKRGWTKRNFTHRSMIVTPPPHPRLSLLTETQIYHLFLFIFSPFWGDLSSNRLSLLSTSLSSFIADMKSFPDDDFHLRTNLLNNGLEFRIPSRWFTIFFQ